MLKLKIVSPEKVIYDGEVESLKVPGIQGSFEILSNHAPIISSLLKGEVEYKGKGESYKISIVGGFVEVKKNEISLCVEI
ncbi:MAG TPA: ATP synthase F1 subunit epsilon [Prevotella sp.]|nr:ATP synthase F1 subunit epsilon [Prevotella sp.]